MGFPRLQRAQRGLPRQSVLQCHRVAVGGTGVRWTASWPETRAPGAAGEPGAAPRRSAPRPGCAAALGGGGSVAPGLRRLRRRQQSVINDFRLPARSKTTASGWREQRAERPRAGALLKSSWGTAGWVPCVRVGELAARSLPRQEAAACEPLENVSQVTVSLWRIWKTPENNRAPFFAQGEAMAVNSYIGCYYPGAGGAVLALASKVTPVPKLCELPGDKTRLLIFAGRPLSKLLTSGGGVKGQLICRDKGLYESSGLHFLQIWGAIRDMGRAAQSSGWEASFLSLLLSLVSKFPRFAVQFGVKVETALVTRWQ